MLNAERGRESMVMLMRSASVICDSLLVELGMRPWNTAGRWEMCELRKAKKAGGGLEQDID